MLQHHAPTETTHHEDQGRPIEAGVDRDVQRLAAEAHSSRGDLTAAVTFLAGAAIALAMAFLVIQNTQSATVEWLAWDPTGPMWIVLVLSFLAGLVTAPLIFAGVTIARSRRRARDRRIDELARPSRRR